MVHLNVTADGTTAGVQLAGPIDAQIVGDLGGGSVNVEIGITGEFGVAYTLTAEDVFKINVDGDFVIRLVTSDSTAPNFDLVTK